MSRQNYTTTDIKMALVQALRSCPMDRKAIKDFLSMQYQHYGKSRKGHYYSTEGYQVSDKTVSRMIVSVKEFVKRLGMGKIIENYGYYELQLCGFPDSITEQDLQSVDIAAKQVAKDTALRKNLETLKTKLSSKLERVHSEKEVKEMEDRLETTEFFVLGPQAQIDTDPEIKKALTQAIYRQHKVSILYSNYTKEITVCPLGLLHSPNNKYLVALLDTDEDFNEKNIRTYTLSQISKATDLKKWFARDNKFSMEDFAHSMFAIPHDTKTKKHHNFEWWVSPEVRDSVDRYTFHPHQEKEYNPDGSMIIKFRANNAEAIAKYIFQWGGGIVPIAPKELVDEYRDLLKKCLKTVDK